MRSQLGLFITIVPVLLGHFGQAQQTTNTNCTLYGNTAHCTSETSDDSAEQRQAYEAGKKVGDSLGLGMAAGVDHHRRTKWVSKYCASHPGANWKWHTPSGHILASGHCATDTEKAVVTANSFMSHHKDFVPGQHNSEVMTAYIQTHNLDPRERKTYERAYKDLKKTGQLELYNR